MAPISSWFNIETASVTFHPLGSCSNALRSALLALFEADRFKLVAWLVSLRFLGRPRSIMLPDSDWFLLCPPTVDAFRAASGSALGVVDASEMLSLGVL